MNKNVNRIQNETMFIHIQEIRYKSLMFLFITFSNEHLSLISISIKQYNPRIDITNHIHIASLVSVFFILYEICDTTNPIETNIVIHTNINNNALLHSILLLISDDAIATNANTQ
jgi:hypothetical protein